MSEETESTGFVEDTLDSKNSKFWSIFWTVLWLIAFTFLLLRLFVYQQVNVVGQSMEPNYKQDQMLIIDRIDEDLKRGQVVAFYEKESMVEDSNFFVRTFPSLFPDSNKFFLKRVIGLPGEEIEIIGTKIIIYNEQYPDGVILEEEYIPDSTKAEMEALIGSCSRTNDGVNYYYPKTNIPDDYYFLMGDNRCHSLDSRDDGYGPFPVGAFFGQEKVRYWPFTKAEVFSLPDYKFVEIDPDLLLELEKNRELQASQKD